MGKNEKTPVIVNEKEYFLEDMSDREKTLLNHVNDLDRKINSARFNLDQLQFGREAFFRDLAESLESETVSDEDYIEPIAGD